MRIITDRHKLIVLLQRLGWFVGLWIGGVVVIGGIATLLRFVLHPR